MFINVKKKKKTICNLHSQKYKSHFASTSVCGRSLNKADSTIGKTLPKVKTDLSRKSNLAQTITFYK